MYESVQLLREFPERWTPDELAERYDIPLEAIEARL